ncbi:VOC family protein [Paenibacillus mendelii]|uniref:VOC family protein n=1 Tax=Paenibacillus mendelii TaxID=206163 RepID=A0ABV6JDI2_9BACL|nr:VOC family protein [Paenibacillus mendelii]MCQ6563523.1 VOC family protein [Paenibacillus mendelii]
MSNNLEEQVVITENIQTVPKRLLKKVSCIYIPSSNPDRTSKWFAEHFQLSSTEGPWLTLDDGSDLMFIEVKDGTTMKYKTDAWSGQNFDMNMLSFQVEDIENLHRSLKQSGAQVEELRDNGGCGMEFYFYDPDGNKYGAWEMQTMVTRKQGISNTADIEEKFIFGNCYFEGNISSFLTEAAAHSRGSSRRVHILDCEKLREEDSEGYKEVINRLNEFNSKNHNPYLTLVYSE